MTSTENNEILTVFSELKDMGIEVWLSDEGWMQFEELLLGSENENVG